MSKKTYLSPGDFIDLYFKLKQKGINQILSKFNFNDNARVISKWNQSGHSSDFWTIPEIRSRWNLKATGDENLEYEDYFVNKYLSDIQDLHMLSVGCGTGARERKFAKYPQFSLIEGTDFAFKQIEEAKKEAKKLNLNNIQYHAGDFLQQEFPIGTYDVILFNSSLHHFDNISTLLKDKIKPLLKPDGYLVVFEFVGPTRLQWTKEQLKKINELLDKLPNKYKQRFQSKSLKSKAYRPGILRMKLIDPSEAIDSESIIPALHQHFQIIEEKKLGWDILHILLKDIAHNFLEKNEETQNLLQWLFKEEDKFLEETGRSDAIFGVYQLKIEN